jgi:nitric oxide reductase large subunit
VVFTWQQILDGQEHLLAYTLMQCGTVHGHGASLRPDFTADYLHHMSLHIAKQYGNDEAAWGRARDELQSCRRTAAIRKRGP